MIWPGMSGSGSATGMTLVITRTVLRRIRQGRLQASPKCCVAARGTAARSNYDPRSGISTDRHTGIKTTDSGARRLH